MLRCFPPNENATNTDIPCTIAPTPCPQSAYRQRIVPFSFDWRKSCRKVQIRCATSHLPGGQPSNNPISRLQRSANFSTDIPGRKRLSPTACSSRSRAFSFSRTSIHLLPQRCWLSPTRKRMARARSKSCFSVRRGKTLSLLTTPWCQRDGNVNGETLYIPCDGSREETDTR